MRRLTVAALAVLSLAVHAQSVHVELGAGQTYYHPQPDGIWYQLGAPHRLDTHGDTYLLGLTGDVWAKEHVGVAWHADYVDLGHRSAWCECTTDDNYDYSTHAARQAGIAGGTFDGSGRVHGLQAAIEPYVTWGNVRIGYQYGLVRFQPTWRETVYAWPAPDGPLTVYATTPRAYRWGHLYGVSVSSGRASLVYTHYTLPTPWPTPALYTGADTLMFVWRF